MHEIAHEYLIGDGVRLRQIFLNLLSNAVKYTPEGGSISFDIAELECEVPGHAKFCFSVTDTGYGMEPDFLAHIFEPFTRAESSVTNKVQGTGLGMAITKNIVDLMGGTITVESEVNMGSRFAVTLMLKIDPDARYDLGAKDILLISDDDTLIRNMSAPIRGTDLHFSVVSSAEEAAARLSKESTDVLLLAGHLRDRSLADTVQHLRKAAPNAMLLFCVDFAQRDQVQETLAQCGVDGLIPPPVLPLESRDRHWARARECRARDPGPVHPQRDALPLRGGQRPQRRNSGSHPRDVRRLVHHLSRRRGDRQDL